MRRQLVIKLFQGKENDGEYEALAEEALERLGELLKAVYKFCYFDVSYTTKRKLKIGARSLMKIDYS